MKKINLLLLFIFLQNLLFAQNYPYCKAGLFSEYGYYSDISIEHDYDLTYATNLDYLGNPVDLKLDIHYPNLIIDPLPKRPLVMMIHGGGFNAGSKADMSIYCQKLAKAGYVAVSIDYRLGWNNAPVCDGNMTQFRYAVFRALQDTKSALRYVVSKAANYDIDTSYIFLAGQSEGGMTAMNCAYMNQAEADFYMPGAFADLGFIDSAGVPLQNVFSIKGVFNWCGALIDTAIIQNDTPIPLLSIHGLQDSIMPVEYGTYLNCQNVNNPYPVLYGPKSIFQRMKNIGICTQANYDANGEHCFFPSLEEHTYIPAKFTCFFKNLMCGNCITESKVSYNHQSCTEAAPVSVDEMHQPDFLLNMYPNPANDALYISFLLKENAEVKIQLLSITGEVLCTLLDEKCSKGNVLKNIEGLSRYAQGIYLIRMQIGNQLAFRKITIQ